MIHVLDVPWSCKDEFNERYPLSVMKGGYSVFKGPLLPTELKPFASKDFSYSRWLEDERNATVMPIASPSKTVKLYDHQLEAGSKIRDAYGSHERGFLLADKSGMGKTYSVIEGLNQAAINSHFRTRSRASVLVVTSSSKVISWRNSLRLHPNATQNLRPLVIGYKDMKKLLVAPAQARVIAKRSVKKRQTAISGVSSVNWDFIVFDDAHLLKGFPKSLVTAEAISLAQLNSPYTKHSTPFVVFATATPGGTPLDLGYLSSVIAPTLTPKLPKCTPSQWINNLISEGFDLKVTSKAVLWGSYPTRGKNSKNAETRAKWEAAKNEALARQTQDVRRINQAFSANKTTFLRRTVESIPASDYARITPVLVELNSFESSKYDASWNAHASSLSHPEKALREATLRRMLRDVSLLKVSSTVAFLSEQVSTGYPIYVRMDDTLLAYKYLEQLVGKKVPAVILDKPDPAIGTEFANGNIPVLISLCDASSSLPEIYIPSRTPAIMVVPQLQRLGDFTSDQQVFLRGSLSPTLYAPVIADSIEEEILEKVRSSDVSRVLSIVDRTYRRHTAMNPMR